MLLCGVTGDIINTAFLCLSSPSLPELQAWLAAFWILPLACLRHLSCKSVITQVSLLCLLTALYFCSHRDDGVQEGSERDGDHRRRGRLSVWPVAAARVQEDAGRPVKGVTCVLLETLHYMSAGAWVQVATIPVLQDLTERKYVTFLLLIVSVVHAAYFYTLPGVK